MKILIFYKKMKITKKNNFTLLEMIISLFLITIIITFLFGFFAKVMKIEKTIEEKKIKILAINQTQIRLNLVFSNIYQGDFIDLRPFYTKKSEITKGSVLHICYDNKIDSDANFSSVVKATLFIDDKKRLCLKTFSRNDDDDPREEVLLTDVKDIEYKFLSNTDKNLIKYKENEVAKNLCWYRFWPKKAQTLPSAIKIKIIKNDDSLDFAFFLPFSHVKM